MKDIEFGVSDPAERRRKKPVSAETDPTMTEKRQKDNELKLDKFHRPIAKKKN